MKKNIMTILILALLIVNLVFTSIMMVSVLKANKQTAQLVSNIATAMNLELSVPGEEEPVEEVSLADTVTYSLDGSMTIPLAASESGKQTYIIFDMSLLMNSKNKDYKQYGESIADYANVIMDAVNSVVSVHTEAECQNDFESIRAEILQAVQDLFQSDFIYKVAISGVKFG